MKNKKGLTLIELLAVIAIIAVLFILLIPQINSAIDKARIAGIQTDFRSYQIGAKSYLIENQLDISEVGLNKHLDNNLQFTNGYSKKLTPYKEPYELLLTDQGISIVAKLKESTYVLTLNLQGKSTSSFEGSNELVEGNVISYPNNSQIISPDGFLIESGIVYEPGKNFSYTISGDGLTITGYKGTNTDVNIPKKIKGKPVTKIGHLAFHPKSISPNGGNSNVFLKSVTIPNSVTTIMDYAFSFNKLKSVTIPNSVTTIGNGSFSSNGLKSITIPNSVTKIGEYAFSYNNLTSVTIPNSLKYISFNSFSNNDLTSVTIPNSVTAIAQYAFSNNDLTFLNIPNSVTSIGNLAFQYNNSLSTVTNCSNFSLDPLSNYFSTTPIIHKNGC